MQNLFETIFQKYLDQSLRINQSIFPKFYKEYVSVLDILFIINSFSIILHDPIHASACYITLESLFILINAFRFWNRSFRNTINLFIGIN